MVELQRHIESSPGSQRPVCQLSVHLEYLQCTTGTFINEEIKDQ